MSSTIDFDDQIQLFAMRNLLLEHELDRVEREYVIDLQRGRLDVAEQDADYYPQIEGGVHPLV